MDSKDSKTQKLFITSLIAGGMAGTVVDLALFPVDTIKTRLQSQYGFLKSGGFSNLYKGIGPVLIGSAPTSALFFVTYEGLKEISQPHVKPGYQSFAHMSAASFGEMVACLIRVPVEVVKQRRQARLEETNLNLRLLYRGYWSTVLRDMPFSIIQFPLWEYFKSVWSLYTDRNISPIESAACGGISGGIAAAATNPLDVAKTRIMLANRSTNSHHLKISKMLKTIYIQDGFNGIFAGVGPRVIWITLGGFIFFGVYEEMKIIANKLLISAQSQNSDS